MDQHTEIEVERWIGGRLGAIAPDEAWRPDAEARLSDLHRRRAHTDPRHRASRALVVAAGLALILLPGTRALGARCVGACIDVAARATQYWRAPEPAAAVAPVPAFAIGSLAPDFVGTDIAHKAVQLSSRRGRVVVVNF